MKSLLILLFAFIGISMSLLGQQKGAYEEDVDFTLTTTDYPFIRTLAWYVPTDYDTSKSYKLIVGFRGGPHTNKTIFRDQLQVLSDTMGAIILCPDNKPHFNNNEADVVLLFDYSVDKAKAIYNIDSENIYLSGLSYGGRHAVITSLFFSSSNHGIKGVIPFAPGTDTENVPHYDNAHLFPPVCIGSGQSDSDHFKNIAEELDNRINSNGGNSLLRKIQDVGHTTDFPTFKEEFLTCVEYINGVSSNVIIEDPISETGFMVYPNPTSNVLFIDVLKIGNINSIKLRSIDGTFISEYSKDTKFIDISRLLSGEYVLSISSDEGEWTEKVLKF